jgi:hypothetical protein
MTCTLSDVAEACQQSNVGTVTGVAPDLTQMTDQDPAHYFGTVNAALQVETALNGQDADIPKGPEVPAGSVLSFTYVVKNTGDVALTGVQVTDSKGVAVSCPKSALQPGESMTCTGSGVAIEGQYSAVGTATGKSACADPVSDSDPVHYRGKPLGGGEGCTPGYWKNHTESWPPTGYSPNQPVDRVFTQVNVHYPDLGNATLLEALGFGGGPGNEGAAKILLRASVAALLNATHPGVSYPRTAAEVVDSVNAALLQSRDAMLALATALDADNNLGCPLN